MGEKPRNMYNTKNKEKFPVFLQYEKFPVFLQYEKQGKIPRFPTKMEADCFPVSENTENKPDLP